MPLSPGAGVAGRGPPEAPKPAEKRAVPGLAAGGCGVPAGGFRGAAAAPAAAALDICAKADGGGATGSGRFADGDAAAAGGPADLSIGACGDGALSASIGAD